MNIIDLLEALMILFFGLSWPTSVYKSYVSRTAKGKSATFEVLIWIGYVFGVTRKILQYQQFKQAGTEPGFLFWFAWLFYLFNMVCITIDLLLYVRNRKLDAEKEQSL